MKKGLLSLFAIFSFFVAFSQEKPKNVSTELVQIKVDPRYKTVKKNQIQAGDDVKSAKAVDEKQTPNKTKTNTTPIEAELRVKAVKKEKTTSDINNK